MLYYMCGWLPTSLILFIQLQMFMKQFLMMLVCLAATFCMQASGQKHDGLPPIAVKEITAADFELQRVPTDTAADAIVLSDVGQSYFKATNKGWFQLVHERVQRIRIVTKNGLDAANFVIPQYKYGNAEEKIVKLVGITYNLNGAAIEKSELQEQDIFRDKLNKYVTLLKFGLPNAREGSIVELTYTIVSDYLNNLREWEFQGAYPRLHSAYTVAIPDFFQYMKVSGNDLNFTSQKSEKDFKLFSLTIPSNTVYGSTSSVDIRSNIVKTRYVMDNVPGLKPEPYTTTQQNYIAKLEFVLSEYRFDPDKPTRVLKNWPDIAKQLMEDEDFGLQFEKSQGWVGAEINPALEGKKTDAERANAVYDLVRNHITATNTEGGIYWSDAPRNIWKNKKGTQSDINLMLTLMLKQAGIKCNPVLLSTRKNGYTTELYALLNEFNYVICRAEVDNKDVLLDASQPYLGFGHLPLHCYNGHARNILNVPLPIYLWADSLKEQKMTSIILMHGESGDWEGKISSRLGYYESVRLRQAVKGDDKEDFKKGVRNRLPAEVELQNVELADLDNYSNPVTVKMDVKMPFDNEDIIYINPMMGEALRDNPFAAAERVLPVELSHATKQTVLLNLRVPEGYEVDELPKQTKVVLPDGGGSFEYMIQVFDDVVQMRTIIDIKRATFLPEEYNSIRELYTYILSKQSEQIVLKKK